MELLISILARISYEVWATVGFVCNALGIPEGQTRRAVEYVACLGITTLFDTAFFACVVGACLAVPTLLFVSAHTASSLWCLMFTPPLLEIFGTFALISSLTVRHTSKRYQEHDA
jgi:hypothetical protein